MRAIRRCAGARPGFEGLARIVVGQQLSVSSAEAIWTRTAATVAPFRADILLALSDAELKAAGLSAAKIRTLRATAAAVVAGDIDFARLAKAGEEDFRAELTAVSGIGPWTADIFRLFCLGHRDAFAPGDLALQVAVQYAMRMEARPAADALAEIAERWRPWRGVAARLLWAYYKVEKDARSGVPM